MAAAAEVLRTGSREVLEHDPEDRDGDRQDERRAADEYERPTQRRPPALADLAREPRAEHEVVGDREGDHRRDQERLDPQDGGEPRADVAVESSVRAGDAEAGDGGDDDGAP